MVQRLHFILPGDLNAATGGTVYDRRIVDGLRTLQWQVDVHLLAASFPFPDDADLEAADRHLAAIDDGELVMIDGLALGAMPELAAQHAERLRLVALVHHPLAAETGLDRRKQRALALAERAALDCVRKVIVTSPATAAALGDYGVGPERIAVVEPGTDEAPLSRRRAPDDESPLELLCVASLIPRKGHELLFEALATLGDERWRLTCVGSLARNPATVAKLRGMLERPQLAGRVTLAGELMGDELSKCYQAADLFVLPTLYEGYGMAVAEAVAHGLPVISTRTGAIPQLVPATAGFLLPAGDAGALQAVLARVLRAPQLLTALGAGARRSRHALRSWTAAATQMSAVLGG